MNTVHFVMSETFAGIEQHVDELLSNNLLKNPILICNESIAHNFNQNIEIFKIKNYGRRSLIGKYQIKKLLKNLMLINSFLIQVILLGFVKTKILMQLLINIRIMKIIYQLSKNIILITQGIILIIFLIQIP